MPRHRIVEATQNVSVDNLPVFYKYRFTYPDGDTQENQIMIANQLFSEIQSLYSMDGRMTMGIEHYTKGMVAAKPHVHIHFVSKVASDSIRHHLRDKFEMIGRVQSCKAEVLVDEDKFWRYPLKQQKSETRIYRKQIGFTDEVFHNMIDVAYACWKQSAEVAIRREEARVERTSRDRLYTYLRAEGVDTVRSAMIAACQYYIQFPDETFNHMVVKGYVQMYCMRAGIVAVEDFVDEYMM